jgi:hypothetical protein
MTSKKLPAIEKLKFETLPLAALQNRTATHLVHVQQQPAQGKSRGVSPASASDVT